MPELSDGLERRLTREMVLREFSPWLTVGEACIYLRCGAAHLYRKLHLFKVRKFAGKTLISRRSVDDYLEAHPFDKCNRAGVLKIARQPKKRAAA